MESGPINAVSSQIGANYKWIDLSNTTLRASVPAMMYSSLTQQDIPPQLAQQLAGAPSIGYLFAVFLGCGVLYRRRSFLAAGRPLCVSREGSIRSN